MKLNTLFTINTVIAGVFGIAFVLLPGQTLSLYNITAEAHLNFVSQLFGAALIGFGVISWFVRSAASSPARQAVVMGLFVCDAIGFVVSLIGQLAGLANALGWSTVVIYLLLALGFGYFQFINQGS